MPGPRHFKIFVLEVAQKRKIFTEQSLTTMSLTPPFSDSVSGFTVMSAVGPHLLSFFDTKQARILRLVNREFRAAVASFPWNDRATEIRGDLRLWRACFPAAVAANVSGRRDLCDESLPHLAGLDFLVRQCCSVRPRY